MKTIREDVVGNTTVRLLETADGFVGIVNGPKKQTTPLHGDDPERLWRKLLAEIGKAHPDYFGYDGARSRFLSGFPDGFAGQRYMAGERTYKTDAVAMVAGMLSLETAKCAGRAECVLAARAFQATNLVFQVEKARITDVLKHPSGAAFVKAAARFADGEIGAGFVDMLSAIRDAGQAPSWPMLTYLPFLWRPDRHLFLKPKVTRDFAYRVGHSFARDYEAGLTIEVYESLLDLGAETNREVADLGPRDLIDIQSFIWVVGAYTDVELKRSAKTSERAIGG